MNGNTCKLLNMILVNIQKPVYRAHTCKHPTSTIPEFFKHFKQYSFDMCNATNTQYRLHRLKDIISYPMEFHNTPVRTMGK